jgi:hypothetical protein
MISITARALAFNENHPVRFGGKEIFVASLACNAFIPAERRENSFCLDFWVLFCQEKSTKYKRETLEIRSLLE